MACRALFPKPTTTSQFSCSALSRRIRSTPQPLRCPIPSLYCRPGLLTAATRASTKQGTNLLSRDYPNIPLSSRRFVTLARPQQAHGGPAKSLPGSTISLTSGEKRVFEYLLDVVKASNLNSELRVAGGWVRDKLLAAEGRLPTNTTNEVDLDIALNNIMGKDFAQYIIRYNRAKRLPQSKIGYVRLNPAKSKHLETATTIIYGYPVDLVNLRTESYGKGSRIPSTVGLGSPEQDSRRRDFTINALYYNIRQDRIEDYTGQGLADLEAGILRTPLEPLATLLDDPLRALRGIRFKATFSFTLEPSLVRAMKKPEVKVALLEKVSRQRIGTEINKMISLSGDRTRDALEQILELDLQDVVFPVPPYEVRSALLDSERNQAHSFEDSTGAHVSIKTAWQAEWKTTALACLREYARLTQNSDPVQLPPVTNTPVGDGLPLLASLLLPVFLDPAQITSHPGDEQATAHHLKGIRKLVDEMVKLGLSLSNYHAKVVSELFKSTVQLLPLLDQLVHDKGHGDISMLLRNRRVELGNWLRAIDSSLGNNSWETAMRLGFIARKHLLQRPDPSELVLSDANMFIQAVRMTGLHALSEVPPLLSGKEIMEALRMGPSSEVGNIKDQLVSWQMEQFGVPSKEEALEFIRKLHASSALSLEAQKK